MAAVLHLLKGADATLARAVLDRQLREGDRVTVVLLPGSGAPELPSGVVIRRLNGDLTYGQLVDLIFEVDQVVTW